ncbi:MAG: YHS domain-containing protein [Planctomycetota bacterium]|nr:MAG: YHS domain-containing protein [Planctomycetota bacterium]
MQLSVLALFATALPGSLLRAQEVAPRPAQTQRELKEQTLCPVSGAAVNRKFSSDYEGQRVYFCGEACAAKFAEFPDKHLYGMHIRGERPENIQSTCPVSGETLENRDSYVDVLNKRVYTCCPKCLEKVAAEPDKYLDVLEGRQAQKTCPVSGQAVDGKTTVVVQGQKLALCCEKCADQAKAAPDRVWAELARHKVVTLPAASQCPVMEEPVENRSFFVTYLGRRVYFCCQKCLAVFIKNPQKYLAEA